MKIKEKYWKKKFKYRFHVLEYGVGWEWWWWYNNDGSGVDVIIDICGDRKSIHGDDIIEIVLIVII